MDYILFNSDGSLAEKHIDQYIQQGSINVNSFFIGFTGALLTDILQVVFTLPNGQNTTLASYEYKSQYEYAAGRKEDGWIITLEEEETEYPGLLLTAIRVIRETTALVNYPFYLVVNETGVSPDVDSGVTLEQLDSYLRLLQTYVKDDEYVEEIARQVTTAVEDNTDDELSETSELPVQNKVVTEKIGEIDVGEISAKTITEVYDESFGKKVVGKFQGSTRIEVEIKKNTSTYDVVVYKETEPRNVRSKLLCYSSVSGDLTFTQLNYNTSPTRTIYNLRTEQISPFDTLNVLLERNIIFELNDSLYIGNAVQTGSTTCKVEIESLTDKKRWTSDSVNLSTFVSNFIADDTYRNDYALDSEVSSKYLSFKLYEKTDNIEELLFDNAFAFCFRTLIEGTEDDYNYTYFTGKYVIALVTLPNQTIVHRHVIEIEEVSAAPARRWVYAQNASSNHINLTFEDIMVDANRQDYLVPGDAAPAIYQHVITFSDNSQIVVKSKYSTQYSDPSSLASCISLLEHTFKPTSSSNKKLIVYSSYSGGLKIAYVDYVNSQYELVEKDLTGLTITSDSVTQY